MSEPSRYQTAEIRRLKWEYMRAYIVRKQVDEAAPLGDREPVDSLTAEVEEASVNVPAGVLRMWETEAELLSKRPDEWAIYINGI